MLRFSSQHTGLMNWKRNRLFLGLIFLATSLPVCSQSTDNSTSLGDVAKRTKNAAGLKAKKVFTDDDLSVRTNPIPRISLQGEDNSERVLDAVREYRRNHTAEETERVVHEWYDEHDEILATAAEDSNQIAQHNQYRYDLQDEGYENNDTDYRKARQRMATERRSQRVDARRSREDWQIISRIQQTMSSVRNDLRLNRISCEWFKIRQGAGVGTF